MSKILNLIAAAKASSSEYIEINFGNIPNFLAQQIAQHTGISVTRAMKVLTVYGISHIFKEHGVGTKQSERGQKDITDTDIELIPKIFESPEKIELGKKNKRGNDSIKLYKSINGYYYCIIVSVIHKNGNKKLHVDTMFAKK